jgi:hypothetical protein
VTNNFTAIGTKVVDTMFSYDDIFVELRLSGGLSEQTLSEWSDLLAGRVGKPRVEEGMQALRGLDAREPVEACM